MPEFLPPHLRKYIVKQTQDRYTALDQAVWRYVLRQLRSFLKDRAHPCYLEGLEKTGITVERIPLIEEISDKLREFGWRALPVSGFIPPAAFMELQALSVLPIASDMRSLNHLLYTPAPDIVHEAAGHAPILIQPEFAAYLKKYAAVARKSIISKEDLDVYNAIRALSDIKENPVSSPEDIRSAELDLETATKNVTHISEAALLGRMNWWTAEYGLIGDLENPRIFGAGLLSSALEAKWCLSEKVKKIPLSIECINFSYDITEPQPQLFVARDFQHLSEVLDEMSRTMAYMLGGTVGVSKAIQAQTVNTIQFDSGIQISGRCTELVEEAYLIFSGPTQLAYQDQELTGHNKEYHSHGFGTPFGFLKNFPESSPSALHFSQWECMVEGSEKKLIPGARLKFEYQSGVRVEGDFSGFLNQDGKNLILTLKNAKCVLNDRILFDPAWGVFDLALGSRVISVFGGAADRAKYGENEDFKVAQVPTPKHSAKDLQRHARYQFIRNLRQRATNQNVDFPAELMTAFRDHDAEFPDDWLLFLEIFEMAKEHDLKDAPKYLEKLNQLKESRPLLQPQIDDGISLVI